jgi:hypothetical protein
MVLSVPLSRQDAPVPLSRQDAPGLAAGGGSGGGGGRRSLGMGAGESDGEEGTLEALLTISPHRVRSFESRYSSPTASPLSKPFASPAAAVSHGTPPPKLSFGAAAAARALSSGGAACTHVCVR